MVMDERTLPMGTRTVIPFLFLDVLINDVVLVVSCIPHDWLLPPLSIPRFFPLGEANHAAFHPGAATAHLSSSPSCGVRERQRAMSWQMPSTMPWLSSWCRSAPWGSCRPEPWRNHRDCGDCNGLLRPSRMVETVNIC